MTPLSQADVSRETTERLKVYSDLVLKWTKRINLISSRSTGEIWQRHIADSAQIFELAPPGAREWVDLGSGGGFPGIVVAILAAERRPDLRLTMIESDQRKATFLRTAVRETGVAATVIARRIEDVDPLNADVLSARALSALPDLLEFTALHRKPAGVALFPKGRTARQEISQALEHWRFDCETVPSMTDKEAVILKIGEIERV